MARSIARQKLRLEPPHLAGGRGLSFDGLAADNPPHGGITSKTLGVVHILITANTSKQRLAEQASHAVPPILAGTAVLENIPGNLGQAKGIIKLSPTMLLSSSWGASLLAPAADTESYGGRECNLRAQHEVEVDVQPPAACLSRACHKPSARHGS